MNLKLIGFNLLGKKETLAKFYSIREIIMEEAVVVYYAFKKYVGYFSIFFNFSDFILNLFRHFMI